MNQKIKIGVMGSAQGPDISKGKSIEKSRELGAWIAKLDCILVTGACPGLPNEAVIGAKDNGGFTLGVSPAFSEKEHTDIYRSPKDFYDIILYTGLGFMERDIINIRSSDAIVIVGGGIGTLNEFTCAYDEGKIIGVLEGTGGISDNIPEILKICNREFINKIIISKHPKELVEKIILLLREIPQVEIEDERVKKFGIGG